ncbi:hypothetical protein K501DRAFT_284521 [Backusella circina FSU 941]|nr:hypothetical protein K501DRAFT_284521 [Backusella circina FSU 941]
MLFSKDSPLGKLDLKSMIPVWLNQLSQEERTQLLTLLPDADKIDENTLEPGFLSSNNRIFWDAVGQWENILLCGGFSQSGAQSPSRLTNGDEQNHFKDENYEKYWGERLERNRQARQMEGIALSERACGRGRGRGRGSRGGRGRGSRGGRVSKK